jgi:rhomboid protease GluP
MEDSDDESWAAVLEELPDPDANEVLALLGSAGIEARYRPEQHDVVVHPRDYETARALILETSEERGRPAEPHRPAGRLWSRRGLEGLAVMVAACVTVFWSTHMSGVPADRARMLDHGAISWSMVESGDLWRLLSAVFFHFDGAHLLANLLTLALVGPPLAHHLGSGRFVLVFLLTGVAGNVASHLLFPTAGLKGGASGAVSGVLGALAGQTMRPEFRGRLRRWHILGALAAIYAMLVGIGPGKDNTAHFGGLLGGLLLGRILLPLEDEDDDQEPPEVDAGPEPPDARAEEAAAADDAKTPPKL